MKKIIATLLCVLSFNVIALPASKATFLFVQTAKTATIKAVPNQTGVYDLALVSSSPFITYFSDRPMRVTGSVSCVDFEKKWPVKFKQAAPNADIVGVTHHFLERHYANYTVVLSGMHYDAATQTTHYIMHVLPKNGKPMPNDLKLYDAALFIDGVCWTCIG